MRVEKLMEFYQKLDVQEMERLMTPWDVERLRADVRNAVNREEAAYASWISKTRETRYETTEEYQEAIKEWRKGLAKDENYQQVKR